MASDTAPAHAADGPAAQAAEVLPAAQAAEVLPAAQAAEMLPAAEAPGPIVPAGVGEEVLDLVFRHARTPQGWSDAPVDPAVLRTLFDLVKLGPTSGNCSPVRLVFLQSEHSRARLRVALSAGNMARTLSAPVTVIVAQDPMFFEHLPRLYPQAEARSWFAADAGFAEETAFRNATLQGGYLILAARMLGLDAAPMSGFDNAKVDEIFLAGQGWRSNFLLSLGRHAEVAPADLRRSLPAALSNAAVRCASWS